MEALVVLGLIFLAGAGTGYAIRGRISAIRRKKYLQYATGRERQG